MALLNPVSDWQSRSTELPGVRSRPIGRGRGFEMSLDKADQRELALWAADRVAPANPESAFSSTNIQVPASAT